MKYYIIDYLTDQTITGYYPQIEFIHDMKALEKIRYTKKENIGDSLPELTKITDCKLNNRSIQTNFMSSLELSIIKGFICDNKVLSIIKDFNVDGFKEYEMEFINSDYKLYYIYKKYDQKIFDYESSSFYKKEDFEDSTEDVKIVSFSDWESKLDAIGDPFIKIKPSKIKLKEANDWIKFPFGSEQYISENLKNKLEEEGITGIEFKPSDIEFV